MWVRVQTLLFWLEDIMKDETIKESLNTALMYLAGTIHASALCLTAFMLTYKLHIYFGFPIPSLDGLSVALIVSTVFFKNIIEKELTESGISVKDALPKLAKRTLFGVLALVLVLNTDTIVNSLINFEHWFSDVFKPL